MESIFIPAEWKGDAKLSSEAIAALPKSITLFSSVNFLNQIEEIKGQLEEASIEVYVTRPKRAKACGQILGCDSYCTDFSSGFESEAFLYIGDGMFHPDALLFSQIYSSEKKPVFVWDPTAGRITEFGIDRIIDKVKKIKANLLKFVFSERIGILASTKHGQENLEIALKLREKLRTDDKEVFVFIDNTFDFGKIEDYNFIDCWVNTACPRIAQDDCVRIGKPIINFREAFDVNYYLERIKISEE